jgi:uncharacterized OB-fold protein
MSPPLRVKVDPVRVEDDDYLAVPDTLADRAHPAVEPESQAFFDGLAEDHVVLQRCGECDRYTHFPVGGCMWCGSDAIQPAEVDGRGNLYTFTVCYLSFGPGLEPPYVVAFVELDCQPGLQIMSNVVGCRISDIRIGMRLRPRFVHDGDLSVVLYEPDDGGPACVKPRWRA